MERIKLYHISYNLAEPLDKEFIPQIPDNTINGEDQSYARVCLSDSIEGCINAAEDKLPFYEDEDSAPIIVWEKEFSLSDKNLVKWQYLYENGLVPDAALTHEYWYLDKVRMMGSFCEIENIHDAIAARKEVYIIKPKYRDLVLEVLSINGVNPETAEDLDLCALVNCWLPNFFPDKYYLILDTLKQVIRIAEKEHEGLSYSELWFGEKTNTKLILDMDPLKVYHHLRIRKY